MLAVAVLAMIATSSATAEEQERLAESRALAGAFGAELKGALTRAIDSAGVVAAIDVCRTRAPEIAARLSRESGARVSRTSTGFRNPQNLPEPWQVAALAGFAETMTTADSAVLPEHFELDDQGGARYLKAIATAPLCLTCHGETLAPAVVEQLAEDYPFDRATGYRLGELRGAFSVVWPAP